MTNLINMGTYNVESQKKVSKYNFESQKRSAKGSDVKKDDRALLFRNSYSMTRGLWGGGDWVEPRALS